MTDFVHLHVHTDYSTLDGACSVKKLVAKVKELGQTHIAITDHGSMSGVPELQHRAKEAGIIPIVGYEAYLAPGSRHDKVLATNGEYAYHLTLLAMDEEGYYNLCALATIADLEGFYYRPRIDMEVLRKHSNGIYCLSGCIAGLVPSLLERGDEPGAMAAAREFAAIFPDRFAIEVQNHGLKPQLEILPGLVGISRKLSLPLVATNDAHYINKADSFAHELLLCIGTKKRLSDQDRMVFGSDEFYIKTAGEMRVQFPELPEAVENTLMVASKCELKMKSGGYLMPRYGDGDVDCTAELERLTSEGLRRRYGDPPSKEAQDRLDFELSVIKDMGFETYFLVVQDFVSKAKELGIPVGPGRGSAAGSIVSYVLGITGIDPLKYGLLFERFLNPGRKEMPDIDIDFCQERRHEIIEYVNQRYGTDHVCQVATFGTLGPRQVIRDVARVMEYPLFKADRLAKMIPSGPGADLAAAVAPGSELAKEMDSDEEVKRLIENALKLQGLSRNLSVHAAAVVITDRPLVSRVPLTRAKKNDPTAPIITQFTKDWVEKIGLLKMDFLGLQNLTTIEYAQRSIEKKYGKRVVFTDDFDDRKTYELIGSGNTAGVFQLESSGMQGLQRQMKPDCIEDITALIALYRPGPMGGGLLPEFCRRKHGKQKIAYPHPMLEPILKETYGVILYQEQAMRITQVMGGFSPADADHLRKAMSKKKADLMEKYKIQFVEGAKERNVSEEIAVAIFDQVESFAGYGFNKSHSAAYSILTYQTAYLKAHYPIEYMAAVLSLDMHKTDKLVDRIEACRAAGIILLPPDVNKSAAMFEGEGKKSIRYALAGVRGVGEKAAENIEAVARSKPFSDLFDFCERINHKLINKNAVEALIGAGALDCLAPCRAAMINALEDALAAGQRAQEDLDSGQMDLFGGMVGEMPKPELPRVKEYNPVELLEREYASLGFFLTSHPISNYSHLFDPWRTCRIRDIVASTSVENESDAEEGAEVSEDDGVLSEPDVKVVDGSGVILAARVDSFTRRKTKDGRAMANLNIQDTSGTMEAVIFPDAYEKCTYLLDAPPPDSCFFITGITDYSRNSAQIKVDDLFLPRDVVPRLTEKIAITLSASDNDSAIAHIKKLRSELTGFGKGGIKVDLRVEYGSSSASFMLPPDCSVNLDDAAIERLRKTFGADSITITPVKIVRKQREDRPWPRQQQRQ